MHLRSMDSAQSCSARLEGLLGCQVRARARVGARARARVGARARARVGARARARVRVGVRA